MTETKKIRPLDEIGRIGEEVYAKIKSQYEPEYNGKILAIDVQTGTAYMADDVDWALELASADYPDHNRYILRIGGGPVYFGLH